MLQKIIQLINDGKYDECAKVCLDLNFIEIKNEFLKLAYDTSNFSLYSFSFYMYIKTNDNRWLDLSFSLIIGPFCFIEGAYSIGLFHARQLVRKDFCVKTLEQLLYFYIIPEKLIDIDEALDIANQILRLDSNNQIALQIIRSNKS